MRIFAYEFITGGGLLDDTLPERLSVEGDLMLNALLDDLVLLPDVELLVSRDPRLSPVRPGVEVMAPEVGEDPFLAFARGAQQCDAVWPIAPETGGVLEELSRIVLAEQRLLLGSHPDTIAIATSKWQTAELLSQAGIPCVPTFREPARVTPLPGPWVIKPDDGAGCADTSVVSSWQDARGWLDARAGEGFVVQPWCDGTALSLSIICHGGHSILLSGNEQHVGRHDARVELERISVNAVGDKNGAYAELAGRIAAVMPGLNGYVGIDLISTAEGPRVLEVNPRLTTSYCGLRRAIDINPAEWVVAASQGRLPTMPDSGSGRRGRTIDIDLRAEHAG